MVRRVLRPYGKRKRKEKKVNLSPTLKNNSLAPCKFHNYSVPLHSFCCNHGCCKNVNVHALSAERAFLCTVQIATLCIA